MRAQHAEVITYSLLLHTSIDVYPGPYTYRRFWFRDAAFIMNALLALVFTERVKRLLDLFPARQTHFGYFRSQEGEWDSNGEVIWLIDRFRQFGGQPLSDELIEAVRRGARWITEKRLDPFRYQCLFDFATGTGAPPRWRRAAHRLDPSGGERCVVNRAMARGHSSANRWRVYGRWPPRVGICRVGYDDP